MPDVRLIPLGHGRFAFVDGADYDAVMSYRWSYRKPAKPTHPEYARATIGGITVHLHTFLMNPPPGMVPDHIDGLGLNCTRANLRIGTQRDNSRNRGKFRKSSSRFLGVNKQRGRWCARIRNGEKKVTVGSFKDEVEAARARDKAAAVLHGPFARFNFPAEHLPPGPPVNSDGSDEKAA